MLHADEVSRRRVLALVSVIALLLGSFMIAGVVQRVWPNLGTETEAPTEAELARMRREAQEVRQLRASLISIAKDEGWDAAIESASGFLRRRDNVLVRRMRAEAYLRAGDSRGARRDYDELMGDSPLEKAALLAIGGDVDDFRRHCEDWMGRLNPAELDGTEANNAAWMCVGLSGGLRDYDPALRLARKALDGSLPDERPTYLNTLGALQYRAGRDAEAIRTLSEAEALRSDPFNWVFLAMAYRRSGERDKARGLLAKVEKRLDASYGTLDPQEYRHELILFWNEARADTPPI
ncbi:MAG TPA: hypothetical protein VM490_22000 [Armatimonadaceae bacterium]|nr:hypothetical protein [Armatimonadaceae bacterium]